MLRRWRSSLPEARQCRWRSDACVSSITSGDVLRHASVSQHSGSPSPASQRVRSTPRRFAGAGARHTRAAPRDSQRGHPRRPIDGGTRTARLCSHLRHAGDEAHRLLLAHMVHTVPGHEAYAPRQHPCLVHAPAKLNGPAPPRHPTQHSTTQPFALGLTPVEAFDCLADAAVRGTDTAGASGNPHARDEPPILTAIRDGNAARDGGMLHIERFSSVFDYLVVLRRAGNIACVVWALYCVTWDLLCHVMKGPCGHSVTCSAVSELQARRGESRAPGATSDVLLSRSG